MKKNLIKKDFQVCIVWAFVLGVLFYFILHNGAGVSTDSIIFLNASENLLQGRGLFITAYGNNAPMTHFPPLYSLSLAGISWVFNCNIENSARLLAALTYALNILLIGCFFIKLKIPLKWNLLFLFLFASSEYLILMSARVFTEPIFISFMLAGFLLLSDYVGQAKKKYLFISALFIAGACLARYAGIVLIGVGSFSLLLFDGKTYRNRFKDALIFGIVSIFPLFLWFLRNILLTTNPTNRQIIFHPIGLPHLSQFIRSLLFIFLPTSALEYLKTWKGAVGLKVLLVMFVIAFFLFLFVLFANRKIVFAKLIEMWENSEKLFKILSVFFVMYPAFLVCSISFVDYTTPLSYRIMLPWVIIGAILSVKLCYILSQYSSRTSKIIFALFCAIFISYCVRAYSLTVMIYHSGLGYSSLSWQKSEIIEFIRKLPPDALIYTNGVPGIYYQTKRNVNALPYKYQYGKPSLTYPQQLNDLKEKLDLNSGYLIFFNNIPSTRLERPQKLADALQLKLILEATDGYIYGK